MASLLFHRLLECAKAIEGGNLDVADSVLAEIQSLTPKEESIWTRKVVKYCAEALVRRAYGIRPPFPLPAKCGIKRKWAQKVTDKKFQLRQLTFNGPDDIVNCISKLRRKREDEIVVVNWNLILHKLLSKVKDLGADIMVIVKQEASLNSSDLSKRLEQS
ncbi:hypothetical protein POTOM_045497 [Populus tomentosa]|uniref:Uncharacterized protein n=1 Tax=Populus tomentosa TaxID=118781 RepID=A0A8X8CE88_POPTO|nr:hypothetical protein POTOM_045497 [Populus tomentosa]